MEFDFVGLHVLGSVTNIQDADLLTSIERIREALLRGIRLAGAKPLGWQTHCFIPQGCTIVGILAESHVSVHTYPEHQSLFFDAFTCGEECRPEYIFDEVVAAAGPCNAVLELLRRHSQGVHKINRRKPSGLCITL